MWAARGELNAIKPMLFVHRTQVQFNERGELPARVFLVYDNPVENGSELGGGRRTIVDPTGENEPRPSLGEATRRPF